MPAGKTRARSGLRPSMETLSRRLALISRRRSSASPSRVITPSGVAPLAASTAAAALMVPLEPTGSCQPSSR